MNNNLLLEQAIRKNPISLDKRSAIITDDLFGFVSLEVKPDKSVYFITYNPLNFRSTNTIISNHKSDGTFFHRNPNKNLKTYIMLNEEKTKSIDKKHDRLREVIYQQK